MLLINLFGQAKQLMNIVLPIPSPKISEMRAVKYDTFFTDQGENVKETTAHARYNNRFTMFKPMSR
jgi:hypothetical protein